MNETHVTAVMVTDATQRGKKPRRIALMRHPKRVLHDGNLAHLPLWTAMLDAVPIHAGARDRARSLLLQIGISVAPAEIVSLGPRLELGDGLIVYPWHLPLPWLEKLDGIVTDDLAREVRVVDFGEAIRIHQENFWMRQLIEQLDAPHVVAEVAA